MSFTVLETEPSSNKFLYYFVSYLYHCCSKRFHNSHIAASFQVILKENCQQIYINQWNCLVKSESFLYKSINFRECKDYQLSLPCGFCYLDAQVIFSTTTEASPSDPPPSTASSNTVLCLVCLSKTFRMLNFQQTDKGRLRSLRNAKQQITQKRRRRSWRNQQMTPHRKKQIWRRTQKRV